jgi:hypothetical protein
MPGARGLPKCSDTRPGWASGCSRHAHDGQATPGEGKFHSGEIISPMRIADGDSASPRSTPPEQEPVEGDVLLEGKRD